MSQSPFIPDPCPAVTSDPKPEVEEGVPEAARGCRPDHGAQCQPAPGAPGRECTQPWLPARARCPGESCQAPATMATLPSCRPGFPTVHFKTPLKEGPRQELVSPRGPGARGNRSPPDPRRARGCLRLRLHLQTLTCSGPHPGKSPGPSQEPELPRPLWCVWLPPVGQASRRCPCPSQGQSSDGRHDDIRPTPAPPLTGASAPDSCCALQPQAQGRELGWSQLQTARPSPQRRLGGGDQRVDQLQGGWPQRTKGCRDSGWLRLAQQGHCRW